MESEPQSISENLINVLTSEPVSLASLDVSQSNTSDEMGDEDRISAGKDLGACMV
jgi:hypothetical protein